MNRTRSGSLIVLIGSLVVAGPACDGTSVAPPTVGTLGITVSGFPPGDWYGFRELSVVIDGQPQAFPFYDPTPHSGHRLAPGDHTVELEGLPSGVPADCTPMDGTERTVAVVAGQQYVVTFTLACEWGRLQVHTVTTGVDPDPDGYRIEVTQCYYHPYYDYGCDAVFFPVPTNGTVIGTITSSMHEAVYEASLTDVADNCVASGPETFGYPAQAAIGFTVTCTSSSGSRAGRR